MRGVEGRYWNENASARPNGLLEKLKLRFCVGDLALPERRKRYVVYQQWGGGRGYKYVPVWHKNRE